MNNIIYGSRIRARKTYGHAWLVYELKDPERPDFVGNRKVIDYAQNRQEAIDYINNLDEEGVKNGESKLSEREPSVPGEQIHQGTA